MDTNTAAKQHKAILTQFRDLPKDLRRKIRHFHTSALPTIQCKECELMFYNFEMTDTCSGEKCKLCDNWEQVDRG